MRRGYFRGFTASEKTELWDRWQGGESLKRLGERPSNLAIDRAD
jgi:IS30 family transposase